MTIDKSLRVRAGSIRNRNVLKRAERIAKLKATDRWSEGDTVLGLPKVRVQKLALKKKKKVKKEEAEAAAETPEKTAEKKTPEKKAAEKK
jgi:small basic protein (TIGR04137 family)